MYLAAINWQDLVRQAHLQLLSQVFECLCGESYFMLLTQEKLYLTLLRVSEVTTAYFLIGGEMLYITHSTSGAVSGAKPNY